MKQINKRATQTARTFALAIAMGAAMLATSCQDDTMTSGTDNGNAITDGSLRVVSLTLDGRELAPGNNGSRAVYDTYTNKLQEDGNYAWTNTAGLVDVNGGNDGTYGQTYNTEPNRIISKLTDGDAMEVTYTLDGSYSNSSFRNVYLLKNASGWEFRNCDNDNHYAMGKDAIAIRPGSSENWNDIAMTASTNATYTIITKGEAPYYFPANCVMNSDRLGLGVDYGYANSTEWKNSYGTGTTANYNEIQAGHLPSADLVASHPGSFHIGTTDTDRGKLTLSLVHSKLALLTLSDDDLTISGWPDGYDAIATLRADQMGSDGNDVNDNSIDGDFICSDYRPVFSRLRIGTRVNGTMTDEIVSGEGATPVFRWQAITKAKKLATGNYGDGTDESYGESDTKATNDADKRFNLIRLHVRLCKKADDGSIPTDKNQWSEEFIVTLGNTDTGIEMRENHRYKIALSLTPNHVSAGIATKFPTWTESEEELVTDDYTISDDGKTYSIFTAAGLVAFRNAANAADGSGAALNAILMNDIDLSSVCGNGKNGTVNANWEPIGTTYDYEYKGTFDGQGHKIKNLYINAGTETHKGLFGDITDGATIRNIKLENPYVWGGEHIGALISYINGSTGSSTGSNITVSGNTISGSSTQVYSLSSYAGGIIGFASGDNTYIYGNTVNGTCKITAGGICAGGIIGYMDSGNVGKDSDGNTISNTVNGAGTVTVKAQNYAGGIIGCTNGGTVTGNSVTSAIVTATVDYAGGIIGTMNGGTVTGNSVKGSTAITCAASNAGALAGILYPAKDKNVTLTGNTVTTTVTVKKVSDDAAVAVTQSNERLLGSTDDTRGGKITYENNMVVTE